MFGHLLEVLDCLILGAGDEGILLALPLAHVDGKVGSELGLVQERVATASLEVMSVPVVVTSQEG